MTALHFALSTSLSLKFPPDLSTLVYLLLSLCHGNRFRNGLEIMGALTWNQPLHIVRLNTKSLKSCVPADPPILDPVFQDMRSRNQQMVTLRCTIIRSNPPRLTDIRWFRNGELFRIAMPDAKEMPELKFKLEPTSNGSYECRVSNNAGTSTCTFNVSGE